ncbi:hypothetical protein GCM10009535_56900 [Streptomyces thermocarboxydovorans]|uniref:Rieske domain-containing protein n=1 Tax=Streptomyces thermocarboxydovorans TaxID=59298 RepID=A0ABP3T0K4_9ACTN
MNPGLSSSTAAPAGAPSVSWRPVMDAEELWIGDMESVQVGDFTIVLTNVDGEIHAFEDRCPHLGTPLSEGDLDGCTLICSTHLWEFHAKTGAGINPGNSRLVTFDTRIDDGQIYVAIPENRGRQLGSEGKGGQTVATHD